MKFIDILVSIVAPIIIPFFNYGLSKVNVPKTVKKNSTKLYGEGKLSVFYHELPTAFIANSIWGITYKATYLEKSYTIIWLISYAFVALYSVGLLIFVHTDYNPKSFKIILIISSIVLFIASIVRIFFF